jgi:hypothetical protein
MWHIRIMRTTIDIPDHLILEAKQLAAQQRRPLTVLFSESLRAYLADQRQRRPTRSPSFPVNRAAKPCSDLDLTDTSALWSIDDSV